MITCHYCGEDFAPRGPIIARMIRVGSGAPPMGVVVKHPRCGATNTVTEAEYLAQERLDARYPKEPTR